MQSLQLLLGFYFATLLTTVNHYPYSDALTAVTDDCDDRMGDLCRVLFDEPYQFDGWTRNRPVAKYNFGIATYRRSRKAFPPGLTRLIVDGGRDSSNFEPERMRDSWIYSPRTNSWTLLLMKYSGQTPQGFIGHTLTTLCHTRVILFGGNPESNFSWSFDGITEEWSMLRISPPGPVSRSDHSACAVFREDSPCQCKESVLVYGGRYSGEGSKGEDELMWEMRCVDDKDEKNMTYRWINIKKNSPASSAWPPRLYFHSCFVKNSYMYVLGGYNESSRRSYDVWRMDLQTATWSLYDTCDFRRITTRGLYFEKYNKFMLVDLRVALIYNVMKKTITSVDVQFRTTQPFEFSFISFSFVEVEGDFLVLGTCDDPCADSGFLTIWKMESNSNRQLQTLLYNDKNISEIILNLLPSPSPHPSFLRRFPLVLISVRNYLLYQTALFDTEPITIWQLDVDVGRWTLYYPDCQPGVTAYTSSISGLGTDHLVLFGGYYLTYPRTILSDELWVYSVSRRRWTKVQQDGTRPTERAFSLLIPMQNGSLILYGDQSISTEIWILTIIFNSDEMVATWYGPTRHRNQGNLPILLDKDIYIKKYIRHAALVKDTFYMYGGLFGNRSHLVCNLHMFQLNISDNEAEWQVADTKIPINPLQCVTVSFTVGRHIFIMSWNTDLWMFDPDRSVWEKANLDQEISMKIYSAFTAGHGKKLLTLLPSRSLDGKQTSTLYSLQPGCKAGTYSPDYSRSPCLPCPKGNYSDKSGAVNCEKCPLDLVTALTGSDSVRNCTCASSTCVNGECILRDDFATICLCNAGFTGKNCQYPTYFLIGFGTIAAVLIVIAFIYCFTRIQRHRQQVSSKDVELRETRFELDRAEETLNQWSNIWTVKNEEIVFSRIIGQGSFGNVWSAEYRDQTVAVKVLKIKASDCTEEQLQEFSEESELLRSIFHANIVQFIGTGKNVEGKPFIVLEYMERGSVRNELDAKYSEKPIDLTLLVLYAMHAARGMRHLHGIGRMHRDLKSDNLLINGHGVVKVADFGCTKFVPETNTRVGGKIKGSRAVGTAFFRAPEIIRGDAYGSTVDVYSYGITLWEIQTARSPYSSELQNGVSAQVIVDRIIGEDLRPEFPDCCNEDIKELALSCWTDSPHRRPTFDEIVLKLECICIRRQIAFK